MEKNINDSMFNTPRPSATSTATKNKKRAGLVGLEIPKLNMSSSSSNTSLGILSLNSFTSDIVDYSTTTVNKQDINAKLQKERKLAYAQLQSQRKLNKSMIVTDKNTEKLGKTEAFKKPNKLADEKHPNSNQMFYKSLSSLSDDLKSGNDSIKDLCDQYNISGLKQTIDLSREEFLTGEDAENLLKAGEISWQNYYDMPKEIQDFSKLSIAGEKSISMGNYFLERCQDLSELSLKKTPKQCQSGVHLIDATINDKPVKDMNIIDDKTSSNKCKNNTEDSLSMSKIQRMLHDSQMQTPRRCLEYLLGNKTATTDGPLDITSSQFTPMINSTLSDDLEVEKDVLQKKSIQDDSIISLNSCSIHVESLAKSMNKSTKSNKENVPNSCCCSTNPSPRNSPNTSRDSPNNKDKSIISTRSGSSLNTFADGKIPIRVSKSELIWGNLKIGKQQTQDLIIKNTCNKRIHFLMNLTGSNYRILKDAYSSDYSTSINVVMHPLETKPFTVTFNPVKVGACVEKLMFSSIGNQKDKSDIKYLKLYGYGGHVNLNFDGVYKDSANSMRLNMGKLDYHNYLSKEIVIKNTGHVCAFVALNMTTKDIHFLSKPQITSATNIVIQPKGISKLTIVHTPTRADMDYLRTVQTEVVQVCSLRIIYGSEVTRGRIRRLSNKLLNSNNNVEPLVLKLSETFTNEQMPSDLNKFSETVAGMSDLLKQLTEIEITLTLEQNLDTTIIGNMNESTMFESLLDGGNETVLENTILNKPPQSNVTIMPRSIVLMPPKKCDDVIVLLSHSKKSINFHARIEQGQVQVTPSEGILRPKEKFILNVSCKSSCDLDHFNVFLHIDNDVVDIDVKVLH